jgi:drug/metabolite transporter (DMT)-like permease
VVLAIGIVVFGESFTAMTFIGLCAVFGGAAWYNRSK